MNHDKMHHDKDAKHSLLLVVVDSLETDMVNDYKSSDTFLKLKVILFSLPMQKK
jgi:hypothetical protein